MSIRFIKCSLCKPESQESEEQEKKPWWQMCLEHNRPANEILTSMCDFRCVLLALTALDSRISWLLTSFFAYVGYQCMIPIVLSMIVFGFPIFYFDFFLGAFTGTGVGWSVRNAVPIMAGIGVATLIQTFLLLIDETTNLATFSITSLRIMNDGARWRRCDQHWILNTSFCTTPGNVTDFCEFFNPECKEGFMHKASVQWFTHLILEPHFDLGFFLCHLFVLLMTGIVSSISLRHVVHKGKFILFPAFLILYVTLFAAGTTVRQKSYFGTLMAISHLSDRFTDTSMKETWIMPFSYFFEFFMIGQGVLTALSRRAQIAGSAFAEAYLMIIVSFWTHVICAFVLLFAVPGSEFLHEATFGHCSKSLFGFFPMFWLILGIETIYESGLGKLGALIVLFCQTIRNLTKIVFVMDTVRTGLSECISVKEKYRPWFVPATIVALLVVGILRSFQPWGYQMDLWIRYRFSGFLIRAILASMTMISFSYFYGHKNIRKDLGMAISSKLMSTTQVVTLFKGVVIFAILFLLSIGLAQFIAVKDGWAGDLPYQSVALAVVVSVFGGIFVMIVPTWGCWLVWNEGLRSLLKRTELWGPQDTRLWDGRYQHLRREHGHHGTAVKERRAGSRRIPKKRTPDDTDRLVHPEKSLKEVEVHDS